MPEQELLHHFLFVLAGFVLGVVTVLLFNKLRSGSASPVTIKREMEKYQTDVEAHFDETSKKFKQMAVQYQDLYKHLSVGATTLCRPENIAPGLSDARDPLSNAAAIEQKPAHVDEQKSAQADKQKPVQADKQKPVKADTQAKDTKAQEPQPSKEPQAKAAETKKPAPEKKAPVTNKTSATDKASAAANKAEAKLTPNKKT